MKSSLTIVTGNSLKFTEMSLELSDRFDCIQGFLKGYHEIQGTPEEILLHKAKASYEKFQQPVLVEDTSFHIDSLNGFPGPYVRDFTGALTVPGIGTRFAGVPATITSWLGYATSADDVVVAPGSVEGVIVEAVGEDMNDSFNFDSIFIPNGSTKTFFEMTRAEKNICSHRGNAVRHLMSKLENK